MSKKRKEPSICHSMIKHITGYVLLPLFAALAVLAVILQHHLSSGTEEALQMMFAQNAGRIENAILQSNYASSVIITYRENYNLLVNYYRAPNAYEKNRAVMQLEKMIQSCETTILGSFQGEMLLVINDGKVVCSSGVDDLTDELESFPWFSFIGNEKQRPHWDNRMNELFMKNGDRQYVVFGRCLMQYQEQPQGYVFVRIPKSVFSGAGQDSRFQKGTMVMYDDRGRILTEENQRFSSQELQGIYEFWQSSGQKNGQYHGLYYILSPLSYSSNVVAYVARAGDVFARSRQVMIAAVIFMFLVTAGFMWITVTISKYITDPILFFAKRAPMIEENCPELLVLEDPRFLEIRELQEGMLGAQKRIKSLLEQVRQETAMREKARFDVLRAQITPHFLFNTLNAVRWKALINQDGEVADILSELGVLLGETYKNTDELETIGSAVRTLEAYVNIMKIRFGDNTRFFFVIPDELKEYLIPRFCLQPLVENSFIHGMSHMENGVIVLRGEHRGDDIVLTLVDNGPGVRGRAVDPEEIKEEKKRGVTGIGLSNINHRLHMLYGTSYGLSIDRELEEGFRIFLTIPAMKEGGT